LPKEHWNDRKDDLRSYVHLIVGFSNLTRRSQATFCGVVPDEEWRATLKATTEKYPSVESCDELIERIRGWISGGYVLNAVLALDRRDTVGFSVK